MYQRVNFLTEMQKRIAVEFETEDIECVFRVCNESLNQTQVMKDKITDMKVFFQWCSEATVPKNLINQRYVVEEEEKAKEGEEESKE